MENAWLNRAASAPGGNQSSIGPGRLQGLRENQAFSSYKSESTNENTTPSGPTPSGPVINTITWELEREKLIGKNFPP
jgi:hypothetical protein